jgi:hypothetical protein
LRPLSCLLLIAVALPACRQIAGIGPITYSDAGMTADVEAGGCPSGTPLYTTAQVYDILDVQNGFVYADVASSGVFRCPTSGCASAATVVNQNNTFIAFALSPSLLYYTIQPNQNGGPTMGSLHSVGFDGTNDVIVAGNLDYPFWVAVSGSNIFWVDDSQDLSVPDTIPATVNCIGCGGGTTSKPWMGGLSNTYGIVADATNVWVLADDGSLNDTSNVYVCPVASPCMNAADGGSGAKVVLSNITTPDPIALQLNQLSNYIAGDGTYFYLVNGSEIDRVDATGTRKTIVPGVTGVVAITIDVPAGNLYYATDGSIFRTKADGTGTSTALVCNQSGIGDVAVDSQNLYFITSGTGVSNGAPFVAPK